MRYNRGDEGYSPKVSSNILPPAPQSLRPELSDPEDLEEMTGLDLLMEGDLRHSSHSTDRGEGASGGMGNVPFLYSILPGYPQPSLCQATVRRFPGFAQGYAGGKRVKYKVSLVQAEMCRSSPFPPHLPPQAMPSKACQQFMMRNFDEVCKLFFKNRTSRSVLIQQTLMTLLPRIAALNQDLFALK